LEGWKLLNIQSEKSSVCFFVRSQAHRVALHEVLHLVFIKAKRCLVHKHKGSRVSRPPVPEEMAHQFLVEVIFRRLRNNKIRRVRDWECTVHHSRSRIQNHLKPRYHTMQKHWSGNVLSDIQSTLTPRCRMICAKRICC